MRKVRLLLPVALAVALAVGGASAARAGQLDNDQVNNHSHLLTSVHCVAGTPWLSWTSTVPAGTQGVAAFWYDATADNQLHYPTNFSVYWTGSGLTGLFAITIPAGHLLATFLDPTGSGTQSLMGRNLDTVPDCGSLPYGPYGPDTCVAGYVWREAVPGDHVCVSWNTRSQAWADNAAAADRRVPGGGAYGPDTCLAGYVWRDATTAYPYPDGWGQMVYNPFSTGTADHVCVTPAVRDQAAADNVFTTLVNRLAVS
jgi:hypothetical protein